MHNLRNDFNVKLNDRTSEWIRKKIELNIFEDANEIIDVALSEMIVKERKPKFIPKEKMDEGLKLCKNNALDFLDSSELLVEAGKSKYGIIFFQFATN